MANTYYLTAPAPTVESLKAQLPQPVTVPDAVIASTLNAILAAVESHLQRGLKFMAGAVEEFDPPDSRGPGLFVFRFPVEQVISVEQDGAALTGFRVFKADGEVRLHDGCATHWRCCRQDQPIEVTYDGGFPDDAWPAEIVAAVEQLFHARWNTTNGAGDASGTEWGLENKSISVDGMTIEHRDPAQVSYAYAGTVIPINAELAPVAAMLEPYRARRGSGV